MASATETDERPDAIILFINSYHRGYAWSDGIEDGMREVFAASGQRIEISYEYLDSRRFAFGKLFHPEVLDGITNITGVNEEMSVEGTIALALSVHPDRRTLAFVTSTGDDTSRRISELVEPLLLSRKDPDRDILVLKDVSLETLGRRLEELPADTLVFLSGQLTDQAAGRALSPVENGKLISQISPFPVYTFWGFHLGTGVLGGRILTGREQGRVADRTRELESAYAQLAELSMTDSLTGLANRRCFDETLGDFQERIYRRVGANEFAPCPDRSSWHAQTGCQFQEIA